MRLIPLESLEYVAAWAKRSFDLGTHAELEARTPLAENWPTVSIRLRGASQLVELNESHAQGWNCNDHEEC